MPLSNAVPFRFKNVSFEINAAASGRFDVSAKFLGVSMEKVQLVFQVCPFSFFFIFLFLFLFFTITVKSLFSAILNLAQSPFYRRSSKRGWN